ncbi:hypothetical protein SAMN04488552_0208 [Christiangramia echinicola]|uniref:Uncharacterized protein n=1 Tax=Christiangramia echinicola TaxID=279359 RepID=A0A1H1KU85_9FLAO|nr:hypothetical protein SAMN04488552_0208 [Christiangramia echinicola]
MYHLVGWIYIWIRYRDKERVRSIIQTKYNDRFYNAGVEFIFSIFGVILISVLLIFLFGFLGRLFFDLIK